ncbi:MAG TPA: HEAT repeat domain-containing protein, partial [Anaerolineae bacterium]|nr:HEAT repeat domain-containing protein [Anaerolineae bacterium]
MRQLKGVTMYRIAGVIVAAVMLSTDSGGNFAGNAVAFVSSSMSHDSHATADQRAPIDVAVLLTQARGAPPLICSLAAQALRGFGWGDWSDAPSTPLGYSPANRDFDFAPEELPVADVNRLLEALSTDDPCVREVSVRILGRQRGDLVVNGLVTRLGASDPGLREVAALGLGLAHSAKAEDALIRALRDATPGVRANSAWALGRLESGRALAQIMGLFRDDAEKVREAAVIAAG